MKITLRLAVLSCLLVALMATAFAQEDIAVTDETVFGEPGVAAIYLDAEGNIVEIADRDLRQGRFVFYAWLRNIDQGIDITRTVTPGEPLLEERTEFAPSYTQNLMVGWVGYVSDDGEVYPVAGAEVRWVIDRQWEEAIGSVHFGAADAAASVPGLDWFGIWDNQAVTLTNNGGLANQARFPIASDFPLYNASGVTTPDTDGLTWVTLFSPDQRARARIIAVASVNGVEVGKEVLIKNFAPAPELELEKTVDTDAINLATEEEARVTFTVTVTNRGSGNATGVQLRDRLTSGARGTYDIDPATLPSGAEAVNQDDDQAPEGFNYTFDLPAGETRTINFEAVARTTDVYCNTAVVESFGDEFGTTRAGDLRAEACFEVVQPELSIIKNFVSADGRNIGDNVTVSADQEALLRIRVINRGTGVAEGLVLSDELVRGDNAAYTIVDVPEGITVDEADAFTTELDPLDVDEAIVFTYPVVATEDGEYCDVAVLRLAGEVVGEDEACLIVATPELEIEKTTDVSTVLPGTAYTSTITVTNTGSAPAIGVLISDVIAVDADRTTVLEYVGSEFANAAGVFEGAEQVVVAPEAVTIPPGESAIFTVTTRVPAEAPVGRYCDIGRYESENAGSGEVEACIDVPAYAAVQNQFVDERDPIVAGGDLSFTSTLINEVRSNEALINHTITYNYGRREGSGAFEIVSTRVYFKEDPLVNRNTGAIVSAPESGTLLEAEQDFVLTPGETGAQTIQINIPLEPGDVIFVVHEVAVPEGAQAGNYTSLFEWQSVGQRSGTEYRNTSSEPTTVLSP